MWTYRPTRCGGRCSFWRAVRLLTLGRCLLTLGGLLLSTHALKFLRALLHRHELAVRLVAFRPGSLAHQLALKLRPLFHGADPTIVSGGFVACHLSFFPWDDGRSP